MRHSRIVRNVLTGVEDLLLHKLRSFLTILGVVFGVGSVVAMLSVGEGASKSALDQIRKLGSNNIMINSVKSVGEESGNVASTFLSIYGLTNEDYQRIAESFETVTELIPVKLLRKEARLEERILELRIVGTTSQWFELIKRPLIAGRTLLPSDEKSQASVAVLTEFGARKLLATKDTLGEFLHIGSNYFQIVGIIKNESGQSSNIQIPDQDIDAYIPINVARSYFGDTSFRITSGAMERERVELHQIIVQVDKLENVESTARALEEMLKQFHKKKDYVLYIPLALLKQAEATKRTFNIVLGSIACISLLVGGIGIMNIMLATVTERIREIGIRRAIGAKRSQIISQFLIETVVLSTIGGIIGVGIGVAIPFLITYFTGMPTVITWSSIILPLFISVTIGIIFGVYPAFRAAQIDPIIALRHE